MNGWAVGVLAGALLPAALACGQSFGDLSGSAKPGAGTGRDYMTYVAEPVVVAAGRLQTVALRLQVMAGFHVNSHTPKSDLLIPTAVALRAQDGGVTVGTVTYPAGMSYRFAADPSEVLDVYQGEVVVRVPVTATAGEHVLKGSLKYQACDARSCFPPKVVELAVPFTAK